MLKLFLLACMLALVATEPKPKPDPAVYYGAYSYTAPWAAAYTAPVAPAYTAPVAYPAYPYANSYYGFRR